MVSCNPFITLLWRHYGCDGVSNRQPRDYLLNHPFERRSKKESMLHVTGLCAGKSPVTGEFSAQMPSNAENVSIWWRHHEIFLDSFYDIGPISRLAISQLPPCQWTNPGEYGWNGPIPKYHTVWSLYRIHCMYFMYINLKSHYDIRCILVTSIVNYSL